MAKTKDHALEPFRKREDPAALKAYVDKVQAESDARRASKRMNRRTPAKPRRKLLGLKAPQTAAAGRTITVRISHELPEKLGEQKVHVTLKDGKGARIERKVVTASGKGTLEVSFDLPHSVPGKAISFAVFAGEEFSSNLQHLTSKRIQLD